MNDGIKGADMQVDPVRIEPMTHGLCSVCVCGGDRESMPCHPFLI